MNCPACGNRQTEVLETRRTLSNEVERRRQCPCGARWGTVERLVRSSITTTGSPPVAHRRATGSHPSTADAPPVVAGGVGGGLSSALVRLPSSDPVPLVARSEKDVDLMSVVAHYRRLHPQSKVSATSKESRFVRERLREGYSAEDLCRAIDGYHQDPWHCGQNDRGKPFLGLDLLMRDSSHVQKGIEYLERPVQPTSKNGEVVRRAIARNGGEL